MVKWVPHFIFLKPLPKILLCALPLLQLLQLDESYNTPYPQTYSTQRWTRPIQRGTSGTLMCWEQGHLSLETVGAFYPSDHQSKSHQDVELHLPSVLRFAALWPQDSVETEDKTSAKGVEYISISTHVRVLYWIRTVPQLESPGSRDLFMQLSENPSQIHQYELCIFNHLLCGSIPTPKIVILWSVDS